VRCIDSPPPVQSCFDELERHRQPGRVRSGSVQEDATPQERQNLLSKVPGPARLLFRMVGREQYVREMRVLREPVLVAT